MNECSCWPAVTCQQRCWHRLLLPAALSVATAPFSIPKSPPMPAIALLMVFSPAAASAAVPFEASFSGLETIGSSNYTVTWLKARDFLMSLPDFL